MRRTSIHRETTMNKRKIAATRTQPLGGKVRRKKRLRLSFTVVLRELAFLVVAIDLCNMAYWFLAPWPIYRIVAFVTVFILWSNFASETARDKTKQAWDKVGTMSTQAVHAAEHPRKRAVIVKPEQHQDTTAYLAAMKKEQYESIQIGRLYDTIPDDGRHRRVLYHPEATPVR